MIIKFGMKNVIFLMAFLLFVEYVYCNDVLLAKFHQNDYKIRDFRAELIRFDEEYYNKDEIITYKYNRSTPAMNMTFNLKFDVQDKIEILVQCYKFLSNEYRYFPLRFQVNLKKSFEANIVGMANVKKCGNVTTFNFRKGITYHICNFVVDESHLPPLIPTGRYRCDISFLYLDEEMSLMSSFVEIYTPVVYPKK